MASRRTRSGVERERRGRATKWTVGASGEEDGDVSSWETWRCVKESAGSCEWWSPAARSPRARADFAIRHDSPHFHRLTERKKKSRIVNRQGGSTASQSISPVSPRPISRPEPALGGCWSQRRRLKRETSLRASRIRSLAWRGRRQSPEACKAKKDVRTERRDARRCRSPVRASAV